MATHRRYPVRPPFQLSGLTAAIVDEEDLAGLARDAGIKPRPGRDACSSAAETVHDAFLHYLGNYARDHLPPPSVYKAWAKQIEACGRNILAQLDQPPGRLYSVAHYGFALLSPGMHAIYDQNKRAAGLAPLVTGKTAPAPHEAVERACWGIELLIELAAETAAHWEHKAKPGKPHRSSEAFLVQNLATAFETLAGREATIVTDPMTYARQGPALAFMRAAIRLAVDRLRQGDALPAGGLPPKAARADPPEGIAVADVLKRLQELADSPNALADRLRRLKAAKRRRTASSEGPPREGGD